MARRSPDGARWRALLAAPGPILADGAMGTMLFEAGLTSGESPERRRKKLSARLEVVTGEIEAAEARLEAIHARFSAPDFFQTTPGDERAELQAEHERLAESLRGHMQEWESLEEEIEALG